jgi:hypothetical protein
LCVVVVSFFIQLFLRGIPELSLKMKRPPKVRNAASAARNAAGAGTGNPDFYRIARIAPLPPSIPFLPVVKETKSASDGSSSAAPNPRYVIQPLVLPVLNNEEGRKKKTAEELEDLHLAGWMPPQEQPRVPGLLEIGDPFGNNYDGERRGSVVLQGDQDDEESRRSNEGSAGTTRREVDQADSTPASSTTTAAPPPTSTDSSQQLSKADIVYLAHQNRILLSHLGKKLGVVEGKGEGSAPS